MALQLTNNESVNHVFDLINRAELFGDKKIDMIVCKGTDDESEVWFKGIDIAGVVGYTNPHKSIRDHVREKNKCDLLELYNNKIGVNDSFTLNANQKSTIYINEPGLYQLIMKSKLPIADKFQDWVTDELLPKIRKTGQEKYLQQLCEKDNQLKQLAAENKEKDERLNCLHNIQKELLSYKKRVTRDETVYIVSTANYARQGIFKIGRTKKEMKFRSSSHNTTHVAGDKVVSLREFSVYDCVLVEKNIHAKLQGLLLEGEHEFFMCPYNLLESIVDMIVTNDDGENKTVNQIIDAVYNLKQKSFNHIDWTAGIPTDAFKTEIKLIEDAKEVARFDVTVATAEQKQNFIKGCIEAYRRTIETPNQIAGEIVWKTFQSFIMQRASIPRSNFRATAWRPLLKAEEGEQLKVKWR